MLILFWTLFGLSSISAQIDCTTINLTVSAEEIVEAGEFSKHKCVLFDGKKKYIEKIENKVKDDPRFAYVKVVNIETIFPNKYIVHVVEREELFAVGYGESFLICDRDLRVLREIDSFESTNKNPILLTGVEVLNEKVQIGDFLTVGQAGIKNVCSAFLRNNISISQQLGKFKSFALSKYKDDVTNIEYVAMKIETFGGREIVINNIDFALAEKIQLALAVESSAYSQKLDERGNVLTEAGEYMYVMKNAKGDYVSFDGEDLTKREILNISMFKKIKVDNLTITKHTPRTEKDIYYCFFS